MFASLDAGDAAMATAEGFIYPRESNSDREQKRVALGYLQEAWAEARHDGVDGDCLAQACLFAALVELVTTYGEHAAATFADGLSARLRKGEFSLEHRQRQYPTQIGKVSEKRTRSPCAGALRLPCHMTLWPRTNVPTGQPVTATPS